MNRLVVVPRIKVGYHCLFDLKRGRCFENWSSFPMNLFYAFLNILYGKFAAVIRVKLKELVNEN